MSKTTTSGLAWLPSAANGISLTPSATAWANGSWVELTSSAPSTLYSAFIVVMPNNGAIVPAVSYEIDLGVGVSGHEVIVGTFRARAHGDLWGPTSTVPFGLIHNRIATGTRVAMRIRHGATSDTDVYRVALGYFAALGGATGYASSIQTVAPFAGTFNTITAHASTPWVFGAWVEVLAAVHVPYNSLIMGMIATNITAPHEIQIGAGAASSESDLITVPYGTTIGGGDGFNYLRFPRPICINAGTRISMRTRSGTNNISFNGSLWVTRNTNQTTVLWEDDFNGPNTLAVDGYTGVGSMSKVAAIGPDGSQAARGSSDFAEFIRPVNPAGLTGAYQADHKTSRNAVFGYVVEIRRQSAWIMSIYRDDFTSGNNELQVYTNGDSGTPVATVANFWDESAFFDLRIEWQLSTYDGGTFTYNSDGFLRIYKDGVSAVNLTSIELRDSVASGLSSWGNVVINPQGDIDNLVITN